MSFHQFHHHSFTFTHWYPVFVAVVVCPRLSPDCMSPRCCFHLFFLYYFCKASFILYEGWWVSISFVKRFLSFLSSSSTSLQVKPFIIRVVYGFFLHSYIVFLAIVYFILVHFLSLCVCILYNMTVLSCFGFCRFFLNLNSYSLEKNDEDEYSFLFGH